MPARAPVASPATTGTRSGRVSACAAVRLPRRTAPCTSSATAAASGTTDTRSTQSSVVAPTSGRASVPIGSPVQLPSPVNSTAPTPLETKHGTMATMTVPLAIATTSSSRITATSGLPKMVAIAAADPASAMSIRPCGSDPSFVRSAANSARPPPRAISGASGPITAPSDRPARAASVTPGRLRGSVSPPARPSAGTCPPRPGRYRMAAPTARPARASTGSGNQAGGVAQPSWWGSPCQTSCCSHWTPARKPNAIADSGRASTAAATSSRTYPRLRSTAWTSGPALVPAPAADGGAVSRRVAGAAAAGAAPSYDVCSSPRIGVPHPRRAGAYGRLRPRRPPRSTLAGAGARVITPGG